jgi:protein O-GlcNAc transferase
MVYDAHDRFARGTAAAMTTSILDGAVRRTGPCPCGSGKRYKECHGALQPAVVAASRNSARELLAQGKVDDAARSARREIELDATNADAWVVLGLSLEATAPDAALAVWQKAVALAPQQPEAHFRIGDFRRRRGEYGAAIAAYEAALATGSTHPVLLNNIGLALQQQGRLEDAERHYRRALQQQPGLVEASANLADLLRLQRRHADAATWYSRAAALNPNVASVWLNLGVCQHRAGALASAQESFERALALKPDDPQVLLNMASALNAERRFAEALSLIETAVALEPASAAASNLLLYVRQQICDWRDLDRLFETQRASIAQPDGPPIAPHNLLALPYAPTELLAAARKWVAHEIEVDRVPSPPQPALVDGKLRIAYLGPDFHAHPLANLLTEVIERHDRTRFEVFGYSLGPDDGSAARARFAAAFDRFIDIRGESFEAAAQRIRSDRIAVLLDTSGYVLHACPEIVALRPAPVQINCIGFAGTLGANFYDYILADRVVAPPEQQANFAERFMYLPHCYLPGDTRRPIGPIPSRVDCGLPDTGFVFCCFNAGYKILPTVFDVWMRLLQQVPGSVLWLLETNRLATHNLRSEAERRGVAAARLIFAPRVPLPEHLARHAAADIFVDTLPYNAHTTANDALFAGLPVLTCAGETFASRVSASQLRAIGLPELVTHDLAAYEALALELASRPDLLAGYRARLRANRDTKPLFDTQAYTRALEALLDAACER